MTAFHDPSVCSMGSRDAIDKTLHRLPLATNLAQWFCSNRWLSLEPRFARPLVEASA